MLHFADRLESAILRCGAPAVVGLDPLVELLPTELTPASTSLAAQAAALEAFCSAVIEQVAPLVPAVKINIAFFEAAREHGVAAFYRLVRAARQRGLLVIADVKRGDIGSTARLYARGHLELLGGDEADAAATADAITVSGYLGESGVMPFVEAASRTGRGLYVLVRPSDPTADVLHEFGGSEPFYSFLAQRVAAWGADQRLRGASGLSCVGAVVAAKDAESTRALRAAMPQTPWLVPGFGAQGATVESVRHCMLSGVRDGDRTSGAVINASRSVIFAFREPRYQQEFGPDWRGAIGAACRAFVEELSSLRQR